MTIVSATERDFLQQSIQLDCRVDGRSRLDRRQYQVEMDIFPHANGSSRVRVDDPMENSSVLVVVKAEVGDVDSSRPHQGRVFFEASSRTEGEDEKRLLTMAQLMERVLNMPSVLDLEQLCIVPFKKCWYIHVDAVITGSLGVGMDALFVATRQALLSTRLPSVTVQHVDEESVELVDFDVVHDSQLMMPLKVLDVPLCVTMYKIGDAVVVDALPEEEACCSVKLHVVLNKAGQALLVQTAAGGSVDPSYAKTMLHSAKQLAASFFNDKST